MSSAKSIIRPLRYEDLGDFWEIVVLAGSEGYVPSLKEGRIKWFNKLMTELPGFSYYGAFREGKMYGGMAIGDFELNLRSHVVRLSSIGMIHTDMLHKKEKVCKDMMEFFIEDNKEKGVNILTLNPFRPDFYKQMGFGYSSCLYHYRIPPASFPNTGSKELLSYLEEKEKREYVESFNRFHKKTHGSINSAIKSTWFLENFEEKDECIIVAKENGIIRGGLTFSFGKEWEMVIEDMFYENSTVLLAFCSFIHSQSDQFKRVLFSTPDDYFYYLLHDPTDGMSNNENCTSTINNMFRVINVAGLFTELHDASFNEQNAVLEITVNDAFFPQNNGATVVEFINGKPSVCPSNKHGSNTIIKIKLDISDFSSLIIGAVNVKTLYRLGLVEISDITKLDIIESIFSISHKPFSAGGL